jgi:hypothetical protein
MTLWCRVSERSFDLFCYLFGDLSSVSLSRCLFYICPFLGVSSISVSISVSLLCLSLSRCLFYVCFYLSVSSTSNSVCVCHPSNSVFAPRIEDTFPHNCISVAPVSQQFGCLGILTGYICTVYLENHCVGEAKFVSDRWVATFISEVLPNPSQYIYTYNWPGISQ